MISRRTVRGNDFGVGIEDVMGLASTGDPIDIKLGSLLSLISFER